MPRYLVYFVQVHLEFRVPEFEACAKAEGIEAQLDMSTYSLDNAYAFAEIESDEAARRLAARAMLVKGIYRPWGYAATYEELYEQLKAAPPKDMLEMGDTTTFRFMVDAFHRSLSHEYQQEVIHRFKFLPLHKGIVRLRNPEIVWTILEDYELFGGPLVRVFFTSQVAVSQRELIDKYRLSRRPYLGTTSMDPELSFIMANMVLARPGTIVMDPFVGTGSVLVSAAHFHAYCIGSDIDPRTIRGTGKPLSNNKPGANLFSNFEMYGLRPYIDCFIADSSRGPWIEGEFLDGIVTDPPYGVREGARQLTVRTVPRAAPHTGVLQVLKAPYEADQVVIDLVTFAARHLRVGGRLVYWLATDHDYQPDDKPTHPCFEFVADSPQSLGKWVRRLITMVKVRPFIDERATIPSIARGHTPSFLTFRDVYFSPGK